MTNASLLISRDGQKSISWELLVVFKSCRTLNGWESSEAMCELLVRWEHLLNDEQTEIILFFFFSPLVELQASGEVESSVFSFLGPRPGWWKTDHRKLTMKYSGTRRWHYVFSCFLTSGVWATWSHSEISLQKSVCLSSSPILLWKSLPTCFLFLKRSKCWTVIFSFWTHTKKLINLDLNFCLLILQAVFCSKNMFIDILSWCTISTFNF